MRLKTARHPNRLCGTSCGSWSDARPLSAQTIGALDAYFRNKSCGYDSDGQLQSAFTAQEELAGDDTGMHRGMTPSAEADFLWFQSKDAWRRIWGPPGTMQTLVFRILRGSNDAQVDLHHTAASECDLDYNIARNIIEAFLASGWRPPGDVAPELRYDARPRGLRPRR